MSGPILVALLPKSNVEDVLAVAVELALRRHAPLSLVWFPHRVPFTAGMAPVSGPWSIEALAEQSLAEADRDCSGALRAVPAEISVERRVLCGSPRRELSALLASGRFDAVVVDDRQASMRRAARCWRRAGIEVHVTPAPARVGPRDPLGESRASVLAQAGPAR